jgi:TRAP-type C4-dicarboxylate transport system substrate-binding protein
VDLKKSKEITVKKFFIALCLITTFSVAILCAQKIIIKVASVAPVRSPWDIEQKNLAQEWAKITNGAVTIQFYDTAAQGGEEGVIQKLRAVRPGQKPPLDGAVFTNIGLHIIAPESHAFTFCSPFLFRNQDEVNYVLKENAAKFEKSIRDAGYELIGWFSVGWIYFMTKDEARTPEKLKLLRLALGGVTSNDITNSFKEAGFRTENISADKLPQSIKTPGGIQGVFCIPMYGYATKFYESLPYVLNVAICPLLSAFVISEKTWEQIPAQYKSDLIAAAHRAEQVFVGVQKENDNTNLKLMEQKGAKLVTLTNDELTYWEKILTEDVQRAAESGRSIIDKGFLTLIKRQLGVYRATHVSTRN